MNSYFVQGVGQEKKTTLVQRVVRGFSFLTLMMYPLGSVAGSKVLTVKMEVYSDMTIKNHHIAKRTVVYIPGAYDVSFTYNESENLLTLMMRGQPDVQFRVPRSYLGTKKLIDLKGSEIGENWNAQGSFEMSSTFSSARSETRQCILESHFLAAFPTHSYLPPYGVETVIVHDQLTTKNLKLTFFSEDGQSKIADLSGHSELHKEIIDSVVAVCAE